MTKGVVLQMQETAGLHKLATGMRNPEAMLIEQGRCPIFKQGLLKEKSKSNVRNYSPHTSSVSIDSASSATMLKG